MTRTTHKQQSDGTKIVHQIQPATATSKSMQKRVEILLDLLGEKAIKPSDRQDTGLGIIGEYIAEWFPENLDFEHFSDALQDLRRLLKDEDGSNPNAMGSLPKRTRDNVDTWLSLMCCLFNDLSWKINQEPAKDYYYLLRMSDSNLYNDAERLKEIEELETKYFNQES